MVDVSVVVTVDVLFVPGAAEHAAARNSVHTAAGTAIEIISFRLM
jgi:hypothetical protein